MRDRAVASAVRRAPVDRHPQPAGVSSIPGYLLFCARFSVLSVVIIVWFLVIGKFDQSFEKNSDDEGRNCQVRRKN